MAQHLEKGLRHWTLSRAHLVIANSRYTQALVQQAQPECRAISLPLAVDLQRFSPGNRLTERQSLNIPSDRFMIFDCGSSLPLTKGLIQTLVALGHLPEDLRKNNRLTRSGRRSR